MGKQRDAFGKRPWPRHGTVAVLVVLGIVLIEEACGNEGDLAGPEPAIERSTGTVTFEPMPVTFTDVGTLLGTDKRFNEIPDSVSEFGGYWKDASGNMVVALTDMSKQTTVAGLISAELNHKVDPGRSIRYEQATYGFNQLAGWRNGIAPRLRSAVTLIDIDQTANKLLLGVETPSQTLGGI